MASIASSRLPRKAAHHYNSSGPLQTFHDFRYLKPKIRRQIWSYFLTFETMRLVPVWRKTWRRGTEGVTEDCDPKEEKFLSKLPPPASLHVCGELRSLALLKCVYRGDLKAITNLWNRYSLVFSGPAQKCPIYIDPDSDIVFLSGTPKFENSAIFSIKHLAVPLISIRHIPTADQLDPCFLPTLKFLHLFTNLTSLGFIIHDGGCRYCSETRFDPVTEELTWARYNGPLVKELDVPDAPLSLVEEKWPKWTVPPHTVVAKLTRGGRIACGYGKED